MEMHAGDQLEKAKLEDTLVALLYSKYDNLVFHGGTSIWRCYGGNRFSRDLDFYIKVTTSEEKMHYYKEFSEFFKEAGFSVKEKGYESSTDTMHFLVQSNVKMKVDINFKYKEGTRAEYTKIDDSKMVILALTPLQLLNEKVAAYNDKLKNEGKFKHPQAHDLYDIYYLVSIIKRSDKKTVEDLRRLISMINDKPPSDMKSLGHLILTGLAPAFDMMIKSINKWLDDAS